MIIVIKNPKTPIRPRPIAEILETALNSSMDGFLKRCQTRTHWAVKELNFSLISIIN